MSTDAARRVIDRSGLDAVIGALRAEGREVLGPVVRDGAIGYDEIRSSADLPEGWTDRQEAGQYRLERRQDRALFGYAVGPHSWKQFLHPPRIRQWEARRTADGFVVTAASEPVPRRALLGVRACELAAIRIQDRVLNQDLPEPAYRERRTDLILIAVNCGAPAATCFCTSMATGPRAAAGFDLALTELADGTFLVEAGSPAGERLAGGLGGRPANDDDEAAAAAITDAAAAAISRRLVTEDLPATLQARPEHPRWDEVASRCLACGNCTAVCPTCFCTTVEDHTALASDRSERIRRWDSCFTSDFSYVHGGPARASTRARYRQWLTHKLSTWHDQFGSSGCVGCGRCISWCPVGIDITEEAAALCAAPDPGGN